MQRATLPLQDWEKPSVILQIIRWLFFFPYVYILNTLMLNKYAEEMNDDNKKIKS